MMEGDFLFGNNKIEQNGRQMLSDKAVANKSLFGGTNDLEHLIRKS